MAESDKIKFNSGEYTLSERCISLRDDVVNIKTEAEATSMQEYFWRRYGRVKFGELRPENRSNILVHAAEVESIIENSSAYIDPRELIVGYNFGDGPYWGYSGNRERDDDLMRKNGFTQEQIDWMFDTTVKDCGYDYWPAPVFEKEIDDLAGEMTVMHSAHPWNLTNNHSVIGYQKIVEKGFSGMLDYVNEYAEKNGDSDFYEALRIVCRAGMKLGRKYAEKAREMGREDIATVCDRVPESGARNLREAIQALWFAHIVNTWEDGINANSVGHLDWILFPYYKHDIDEGLITKQDAFELICCLWLKLYRDYDVQQSCVGGRDENGKSLVNELSYMMLEATEKLDFVRCISVRLDKNTDREFVKKALQVVGRVQKGVPFFFNDDVMIPALESGGISHKDACEYTAIGCVETVIPGKSNPHAVNSRINVLKALEHLVRDESILKYGDFDSLFTAVKEKIDDFTVKTAEMIKLAKPSSDHNNPCPVKSLLTEGCVERGKDFNDSGAKYDYYHVMLMGVPNLADSLAAIKTLVYDKKLYTMEQLVFQLKNNWPDEAMRLDFVNKSPKYGNDIKSVDDIAGEIIEFSCCCMDRESERIGLRMHAQPFTYLWMIEHGAKCMASADGRRDGEILAYSLSPMQGRDREGLTALMNSISSLPTKHTPGTTSAIVEIDPKLFSEENIDCLTDILMTSAAKGISNVQFNTVSLETLLDAQAHPERHMNLAVRVSGFSQKFNLIGKPLQDHIIARTKHACI